MKPRTLPLWGSLAALLVLVLFLGTADIASSDGTFNPTLRVEIVDPSAGANSNVISAFDLPEGDLQFGGLVSFIPGEWEITPGEDIPIGAIVGDLTADATLGLINGACNNVIAVEFVMLNASIDPTDTVPFEDTNPEADEEGYDPDDPGNDVEDFAEDRDGSGLQDAIEKYPEFIPRVLDDEDGNPRLLKPIRRAAGITVVAGANVLLQFLIFEPGTFIHELIPNDEELGYPTVTLLQAAGDPDAVPTPGVITDFCTPLISSNITFGVSQDNPCTDDVPVDQLDPLCEKQSAILVEDGAPTNPDEAGIPLFTNPGEGTYTFTAIAASQRDTDLDGFENSLDTCIFDPNLGDPRIGGDGDEDGDGLDAACDPNDTPPEGLNSDEDLDGYPNRQDNCPLDANGEDADNQEDTDLDGVGDACDPNPDDDDAQGEPLIVERTVDVTIGPGVAPTQDETPEATATGDDDDGGGGATIFIIIGVIAAVVVIGGGAFLFMRRGGGP